MLVGLAKNRSIYGLDLTLAASQAILEHRGAVISMMRQRVPNFLPYSVLVQKNALCRCRGHRLSHNRKRYASGPRSYRSLRS